MEQRPLRLGDIVDDYCPRERRITNHVIVALVEDAIRQTRCSTCDTEHVFKAARLPRKRLKDGEAADAAPGQLVARTPDAGPAVAGDATPEPPRPAAVASSEPVTPAPTGAAPPAGEDLTVPTDAPPDDVWPAHRRLIRATLPRVEGEQKEPRPIPEFTMHQRQGRGGNGYRGEYWPNGNSNGNTNNGNGRGGGNFRQAQPGQKQGQPGSGGGGGRRWRHRRRGRGPKPT
jgi:hypothetical protein